LEFHVQILFMLTAAILYDASAHKDFEDQAGRRIVRAELIVGADNPCLGGRRLPPLCTTLAVARSGPVVAFTIPCHLFQ
jgi:hypothetical protein